MTQNGEILKRRRTPTSQDKTRSSYLKEGLLLLHGRGLGMHDIGALWYLSKQLPICGYEILVISHSPKLVFIFGSYIAALIVLRVF